MKQQTIYTISGLSCNNCVTKVTNVLAPFADNVEVTLTPPQLKLSGAICNKEELNAALNLVGKYQIGDEILPAPTKNNTLSDKEDSSLIITYKPLMLVFAYILLVCFAVEIASGSFNLHRFMPNFMAGFFLVFSFFKLLDIKSFASSYSMYDLLAQKIPAYGLVYPFIELSLGTAYLLAPSSIALNWLTLIVMGFSTLGVLRAVLNKQKIRCACLGTGFNLPMSTITLIEDLLMVAMAAWMLL